MQSSHTYSSPPIQEALINVRGHFDEKLTVEKLDQLYETVKEDFPNKTYSKSMTVSFDGETSSVENDTVEGLVLRSADGNKVIQVTNDGYIFSYIKHYPGWEDFLNDAIKYLVLITETLDFTLGSNLLTRFINNISMSKYDYKKGTYFNTKVVFQDERDMPDQYFIQYIDKSDRVTCNVIQTRNTAPQSTGAGDDVNVVLDIEAVYTEDTAMEEILDLGSEIWNSLRIAKNDIFESTMSDVAKEKFDE